MSQQKVDRYKEEKKNRKSDMAKAKRNKIIGSVVGVAAAVVIVGWIGYSGYTYVQANTDEEYGTVAVDITPLTDWMTALEE